MRLLAVDGNSIVNRAFYGIRPLTTKDGQFTNAIYGFLTMLYKIKNEENPDAVAIAFDLKNTDLQTQGLCRLQGNTKRYAGGACVTNGTAEKASYPFRLQACYL